MKVEGNLSKMKTELLNPVRYTLTMGDDQLVMNDLLNQPIKLTYEGQINCIECNKITKKSFAQGFCYQCFMSSPNNSECIIRPELCEGHLGIGRDPEWEKENHVQPHIVYLALTSQIKVGVTRKQQIPTRWIDQGAWKAIQLAEVPYRKLAGSIEVALKKQLSDKTSWQAMLKNNLAIDVDLLSEKERIASLLPQKWHQYIATENQITEINYPVLSYPNKVKSYNLDKDPYIKGKLMGIKGQYLIFEGGMVINIRKFSGYHISIEA